MKSSALVVTAILTGLLVIAAAGASFLTKAADGCEVGHPDLECSIIGVEPGAVTIAFTNVGSNPFTDVRATLIPHGCGPSSEFVKVLDAKNHLAVKASCDKPPAELDVSVIFEQESNRAIATGAAILS